MGRRIEIQGHRGARGEVVENTLASFERALDACVDSIETDLHRTADGEVVLWHDPVLNPQIVRNGGEPSSTGKGPAIAQLKLEEIRTFRADGNPDPRRFPDQGVEVGPVSQQVAIRQGLDPLGIPTLNDLILLVEAYGGEIGRKEGKTPIQREQASRVILDLELKRVPFYPETIGDGSIEKKKGALEETVVEQLRSGGVLKRAVVRSFDHRCVQRILEIEPELTGAILVADTALVDPVAATKNTGASIYCPNYPFVDGPMVAELHAAGIRVLVWTANDVSVWQKLVEIGVDGITTDYPHRLQEWWRSYQK